ncbi:MAG: PASTA domain-containing protein [Actinomycetota bacterium]|nr:PASTA domain-containing protein [Actinomycetota bacterium]
MRLMRDLVGTTFSGRYHLVSRLAGGGMGEVYRGHDLLLDRPVAVKVLQPSLATDPLLVERFKAEARAAARLSHPNVVAVYDWGQEDEHTYYMVMEYVSGSDLRDLLVARGSLSPAQSVEIMAHVCDALSESHDQGLVHRDIKPENVLIARDGKIKVADFGIAVVADADRSMPGGGIPGTLRYLSPEQARGHEATYSSDIWAAGAVLSELLTGQPPLLGAGSQMLNRRAVEDVPPPSAFDASVPAEVDDVVLRACALDPLDRFFTASEMGAALRRVSIRSLPDSEPLEHLLRDLTGEVGFGDMHPTSFAERPRRTRRSRLRLLRAVAVLGLLGALLFGGLSAVGLGQDPVRVPQLVGLPKVSAEKRAEELGLGIRIERRLVRFSVPKGEVVGQSPEAGRVEEGDTIRLSISKGPPLKDVPSVAGMAPRAAERRLTSAGFELGPPLERYSPHDAGVVFRQIPAQGQLTWGSEVSFVVSRGPRPVAVPDVIGGTEEEATAALEKAGFTAVVLDVYSDDIPPGQVLAMNPTAGAMTPRGSDIEVQVSLGPEFEKVKVPDVRGLSLDSAIEKLSAVGLSGQEVASCDGGKTVVETDPIAGTTTRENQSVALFTC